VLVFAFIGLVERIRLSLEPEDSSAIFGGRLESGYDFAGYMVSDKGNGDIEVCGTVIINKTTAITAAHCVDSNLKVSIGLGNFSTNINDYYTVAKVDIHPNWENGKSISSDVAVLTLQDPIILNTYGEISTAEISCDYTVVGYGKQDNNNDYYPLRKSADLCIESTNFSDESISFNGEDGGLCFGDSGSPIFKKGTNQFVSVASRIDACYTKNFGVGSDLSEQIDKFNIGPDNPVLAGTVCGSIDDDNNKILNASDLNTFVNLYNQKQKCSDVSQNYTCGSKDFDRNGLIELVDFGNFAKKYVSGRCV